MAKCFVFQFQIQYICKVLIQLELRFLLIYKNLVIVPAYFRYACEHVWVFENSLTRAYRSAENLPLVFRWSVKVHKLHDYQLLL